MSLTRLKVLRFSLPLGVVKAASDTPDVNEHGFSLPLGVVNNYQQEVSANWLSFQSPIRGSKIFYTC